MIRFAALAFVGTLLAACGAAQPHEPVTECKNVKVAYWQDKNETQYKYKVSYLCELPDGATVAVTPLASETRIPQIKCK